MKIGYPCINRTLPCTTNRTFRLASFSQIRLIDTIENNLDCLQHVLLFNRDNNILFFRITSDLIPFASHPINRFDWQNYFKDKFKMIGELILKNNMRVSMHPDQFTLINSPNKKIFDRSVKELEYHATLLDLMALPPLHKIQIHIGGVYKNKQKSIKRFIKRYSKINTIIKRRLVIENDDRNYTVEDCMNIHEQIGIPILFDALHHTVNNSGEAFTTTISAITKTWKKCKPHDLDIMLEIKNKEKSAAAAIKVARRDQRFIKIT